MWWRRLSRAILLILALAALVCLGTTLYLVSQPRYAWLAFGRDERLRVLLCDRNLWKSMTTTIDGKQLPARRARDWREFEGSIFQEPGSETTYTLSHVTWSNEPTEGEHFLISVRVDDEFPFEQYCDLALAGRDPQSASVAHFDGPLSICHVMTKWKLPESLALERGEKPYVFRAHVGTFDEQRGCWVVVRSHDREGKPAFAPELCPVLEVAFPARSPGEEPIRQQTTLNSICCGCLFYAPVPVPDESSDGVAQVTYTFPGWPEERVAPTTLEVPIVAAKSNSAETASE